MQKKREKKRSGREAVQTRETGPSSFTQDRFHHSGEGWENYREGFVTLHGFDLKSSCVQTSNNYIEAFIISFIQRQKRKINENENK